MTKLRQPARAADRCAATSTDINDAGEKAVGHPLSVMNKESVAASGMPRWVGRCC